MMRRAPLLPILLVALICSPLAAAAPDAPPQKAAPNRPKLPKGITAEYDVPYVPDADPAQALDIYFPESPAEKPQPLLIWIHGGGWAGGGKNGCPYVGQVPRGYIAASLEYRFSQKAKFPAQIQDCLAAIRWLRANAKKYNIDVEHIGVGGNSAGGHLSALVGTSGGKKAFPAIGGNEDQSDRVQAVCDIYGPTDFSTVVAQAEADHDVKYIFKWDGGNPYTNLIGGKLTSDNKENCDAVSPVHYVSKDCPAFLILHGDRDALVPYAQSVELADLLGKAGVEVTLQRLPGSGHGGPAFGLPAIQRLTTAFFDKHLKGVDAKIEAAPEDQVTVKPAPAPPAAPAAAATPAAPPAPAPAAK